MIDGRKESNMRVGTIRVVYHRSLIIYRNEMLGFNLCENLVNNNRN